MIELKKQIEADTLKRRALIPLEDINTAVQRVLAGGIIEGPQRLKLVPTGPGRGFANSGLSEAKRAARMSAMPRTDKGMAIKAVDWTDEQRASIAKAISAAEEKYLKEHPEERPDETQATVIE